MYYLYGENVIINVREDPHMGSVGPSTTCFKTHQPVERRMYAMINNFHLGLEIPMAVTGAGSQTAKTAEVVQTEASSGIDFGASV